MGTAIFQDELRDYLQIDSPACPRPKSRMMVANKRWYLLHIDFEATFLQGQSYDVTRDVVCQLPPEASLPPCIDARFEETCIWH